MRYKSHSRQLSTWGITASYVGDAIAAALTLPRIESQVFPGLFSPMSISSATAIYSSVDELLRLAFGEICYCGASSVQVMRRMNALISDLIAVVPEDRRPGLSYWQEPLKATIARSFTDGEERMEASKEARQGLGAPYQHSSG